MLENKKRNKDKNQVENNKESKYAIKKVFEHALIEKNFSTDKFDEVIKDKNIFLKIFSPWHQAKGEELIQGFVNNVKDDNSTNDFSWLDILDEDSQWKKPGNDKIKKEVKDKNKHVNMRYQIPTHFHGDIDNAVLFYCMENPRGYLGGYGDNQIDSGFGETNLKGYYGKSYKLLNEDKGKRKTIKKIKTIIKTYPEDKDIKEIICERYQLNDVNTDLIEKIIYSDAKEDSPLTRELETMFKKFKTSDYKIYNFRKGSSDLKDFYYFKNYFKQLLLKDSNLKPFQQEENKNKAIEIANKICNVEIYPFSCAQPNLGEKGIGEKILLNSDLSRLGAYIILRRIYRYLNNPKKNPKPIIVLRKYDRAWKKLFKEIFEDAKISEYEKVLELLEKDFFYCQTGQQGGGITDGNVISVPNFREVDRKNSKEFKKTKLNDFNSIKSLLTKVEM